MINVIFPSLRIDTVRTKSVIALRDRTLYKLCMGVGFSSFSNKSSGFKGYFQQEAEELNLLIANGVFLIILFLTTLLGNSTILITIWKTSPLHSGANILLANLAVSDLTVGLLLEPFYIANILITVKYTVHVFVLYNIPGGGGPRTYVGNLTSFAFPILRKLTDIPGSQGGDVCSFAWRNGTKSYCPVCLSVR